MTLVVDFNDQGPKHWLSGRVRIEEQRFRDILTREMERHLEMRKRSRARNQPTEQKLDEDESDVEE